VERGLAAIVREVYVYVLSCEEGFKEGYCLQSYGLVQDCDAGCKGAVLQVQTVGCDELSECAEAVGKQEMCEYIEASVATVWELLALFLVNWEMRGRVALLSVKV